jgi:hypothetical protein
MALFRGGTYKYPLDWLWQLSWTPLSAEKTYWELKFKLHSLVHLISSFE